MKNQKLTFPTLFFFLIFIFPNLVLAQTKYGLMPLRVKIVKKTQSMNSTITDVNTPKFSSGDILEEYSKSYYKMIEENLLHQFAKDGSTISKINIEELTKEERQKEIQLYDQIIQQITHVITLTDETVFIKNKDDRKITKAAPLANKFADKLDRDYLLYVVAMGHHFRRKKEEKKNNPYPTLANGNMALYGIVVDSNNGLIVEYFDVKLKKNSKVTFQYAVSIENNVEMTGKKVKKMVSKFIKKLNRKMKKL